jgi:hypothetical protein
MWGRRCWMQSGTPPYVVNLDPAVTYMPYSPNIDIRDTVDYKNVMKQYNLGPNGGILTACNLFATQFDQARPAGLPHAACLHAMRGNRQLTVGRSELGAGDPIVRAEGRGVHSGGHARAD